MQHARTGEPIGYGAAFGRYLITVVFGIFYLPLLLDYLWPALGPAEPDAARQGHVERRRSGFLTGHDERAAAQHGAEAAG